MANLFFSGFSFGGPGGGGGGFSFGGMGGMGGRQRRRQEPLKEGEKTEHDLKLSLEQLFAGTTKRLKVLFRVSELYFNIIQINRKRRTPHGQYITEEKILTIEVKAGWKSGTKITFNSEGDEKPGYKAGHIIFVIKVYFLYFTIFITSFRKKSIRTGSAKVIIWKGQYP